MKHKIYRTAAATLAVAMLLSGCGKTPASNSNEPVKVSIQTESEGGRHGAVNAGWTGL